MRDFDLSPPDLSGGLNFIEQLQMSSGRLCQNQAAPWLSGRHKVDKILILTRGSCKQWKCPSCAARMGKKWIARVLDALNGVYADRDWGFITLTAPSGARGRDASMSAIRKGWKRLYNRAIARWGKSPYVRVWEPHDDGSMHMHALTAFPFSWHVHHKTGKPVYRGDGSKRLMRMKDVAVSCGLGYQADVRKTENAGQVAGYIAKYLVKHLAEPDLYPPGCRRIEVSRDWPKLKDVASDYDWDVNVTREGQDRGAMILEATEGFRVVDLRPDTRSVTMAIDLSL